MKNTLGLIPDMKVTYWIDFEQTLHIRKLIGTPSTIPLNNVSIHINHGTLLKGFFRGLLDYGDVTIKNESGEFILKSIRNTSKLKLALQGKSISKEGQVNHNQNYVSKIEDRGLENFDSQNDQVQKNVIDEIVSEYYQFK